MIGKRRSQHKNKLHARCTTQTLAGEQSVAGLQPTRAHQHIYATAVHRSAHNLCDSYQLRAKAKPNRTSVASHKIKRICQKSKERERETERASELIHTDKHWRVTCYYDIKILNKSRGSVHKSIYSTVIEFTASQKHKTDKTNANALSHRYYILNHCAMCF